MGRMLRKMAGTGLRNIMIIVEVKLQNISWPTLRTPTCSYMYIRLAAVGETFFPKHEFECSSPAPDSFFIFVDIPFSSPTSLSGRPLTNVSISAVGRAGSAQGQQTNKQASNSGSYVIT